MSPGYRNLQTPRKLKRTNAQTHVARTLYRTASTHKLPRRISKTRTNTKAETKHHHTLYCGIYPTALNLIPKGTRTPCNDGLAKNSCVFLLHKILPPSPAKTQSIYRLAAAPRRDHRASAHIVLSSVAQVMATSLSLMKPFPVPEEKGDASTPRESTAACRWSNRPSRLATSATAFHLQE